MDAAVQPESRPTSGQHLPPVETRWQKGVSGNPGGKSKALKEFREACREHSDEAVQTLLTVMRNQKAMSSAKVQAARTLLSYAWGAPKEQEDGENSKLVINILKLAMSEPQVIEAPSVRIERLGDA